MRIPTRSLVRALCSSSLVTGLAAPALAQDTQPAPESYRAADEHGVDLVTGTFNFAIEEGRIGPAEGGIAMIWYYGQSGYRDNWSGDLRKISEGGQKYIVITFGPLSERFRLSGSSWIAEKANGATLVETGLSGASTGSLPPPDWLRRTGLKFLDLSQVTCSASATNCDAVAGSWPTVTYTEAYSAPRRSSRSTTRKSEPGRSPAIPAMARSGSAVPARPAPARSPRPPSG